MYPVLAIIPDIGRGEEQLRPRFERLGLTPVFHAPSSLPTPHDMDKGPLLGMVIFQDLMVQQQVRRAADRAKEAGLPYAAVTRRSSGWEEAMKTFSLGNESPAAEMVGLLLQHLDDRPWCWAQAVLLHPSLQDVPETARKSKDLLKAYLKKLPPERLPESFRPRTLSVDAPPRPKEVPPPPDKNLQQEVLSLREKVRTLQEEADVLAPIYEEQAQSFSRIVAERDQLLRDVEEVRASERSLVLQVADLSTEIGNLNALIQKRKDFVDPKDLPTLSAQWKEEGQKEERRKWEGEMTSLRGQVAHLQRELALSDEANISLEGEVEKLKKQVAERPARPAVGRPVRPTPALSFEVMEGLRTTISNGYLTYEEAFQKIMEKVKNGSG